MLILDDLSNPGLTVLGKRWQFFTDQVMGGQSTGKVDVLSYYDRKCYRMTGDVSTKNNGGFIQMRTELDHQIAQSNYTGILLEVFGNNNDYFIHIRTSFTKLPWQYYTATFNAPANWTEVKIPFTIFSKSNFYQPKKFNFHQIKTIGIVAAWKDFDADIAVSKIAFF
tara:strand:- start:812 stop:1312 length:501 start_codon:yes stop_codon:yes gene_type:complete